MNIIKIETLKEIKELFKKINVSPEGIAILEPKIKKELFYIKNLKTPAANILKQELLSIGGDLAVPKDTICCGSEFVDVVIIATTAQLRKVIKKLKVQPFGLKTISQELQKYIKTKEFETKIMGVINANDDSFYENSRFVGSSAIEKIEQMIEEGAKIIDIGGVSSRPGSKSIAISEELERLKPIIDKIHSQKLYERVDFSIDSYEPEVIEYALGSGFKIANDITGLIDDRVCEVVAKYNATAVIMHKKGKPERMQENPTYKSVILEVEEFFQNQIEKAEKFGIKDTLLDVGIGFGKSLEHNLELLNFLPHFQKFGKELLVGASRKSMIDMIVPTPTSERLAGTLAIHLDSITKGASIIRCHDVKEHFQAIEVQKRINCANI